MKKVVFACTMLLLVAAFSNTNKSVAAPIPFKAILRSGGGVHIPPSEVPNAVMNKFNRKFPNARRVQWEIEREDGRKVYQAEFTLDGVRYKAQFLSDGTFLGRERSNSGGGDGNSGPGR